MASTLQAFFGKTQEMAKADYKTSSGTKTVCFGNVKEIGRGQI